MFQERHGQALTQGGSLLEGKPRNQDMTDAESLAAERTSQQVNLLRSFLRRGNREDADFPYMEKQLKIGNVPEINHRTLKSILNPTDVSIFRDEMELLSALRAEKVTLPLTFRVGQKGLAFVIYEQGSLVDQQRQAERKMDLLTSTIKTVIEDALSTNRSILSQGTSVDLSINTGAAEPIVLKLRLPKTEDGTNFIFLDFGFLSKKLAEMLLKNEPIKDFKYISEMGGNRFVLFHGEEKKDPQKELETSLIKLISDKVREFVDSMGKGKDPELKLGEQTVRLCTKPAGIDNIGSISSIDGLAKMVLAGRLRLPISFPVGRYYYVIYDPTDNSSGVTRARRNNGKI